ncbi:MAG: DedA family protein [Clostridiales bacterium]|nr:DedA family protein [Clostridiales bacterium]MCF8022371.1 DedA family protein [Clostridiales bacterium]
MDYREIVTNIISTYGYAGLGLGMLMEFTGLPFPGEIALGFAGFMVYSDVFKLSNTISVVLGFSWLGTLVSYYLGYRLGRPFLIKYGSYIGLDDKKIINVEEWFGRNRVIVLVFGRFISVVRPLSAYVAGMARMKWFYFLIFSFIGTSLWTMTYVFIGILLGASWTKIESYSFLLGLAFFIFSVVLFVYFWRRSRQRKIKDLED